MLRFLPLITLLSAAPAHAQDYDGDAPAAEKADDEKADESAETAEEATSDETEGTAPVDPLEGHSHIGAAFNEGPRQAAYLMPRSDAVHFPITSSVDGAQEMFDQAMGQLHGFWYFEAERSFRQVAALDPDCAIAYWGMAMSNVDNEERAAPFAREAWLRRDGASHREQLYIDPLAKFYDVDYPEPAEGEKEHERKPAADKKRAAALIRGFEEILFQYPDDIEGEGAAGQPDVAQRPQGDPDLEQAGEPGAPRPGVRGAADAPGAPLPHPPVGREGHVQVERSTRR